MAYGVGFVANAIQWQTHLQQWWFKEKDFDDGGDELCGQWQWCSQRPNWFLFIYNIASISLEAHLKTFYMMLNFSPKI